jgi:hypothetical protein
VQGRPAYFVGHDSADDEVSGGDGVSATEVSQEESMFPLPSVATVGAAPDKR